MTKLEELIFQCLIYSSATSEDLCKKLNISLKELFQGITKLRNNGYNIFALYDANGNIKYSIAKGVKNGFNDNYTSILSDKKENSISFVAISDTHFCDPKSSFRYINMVYDFCVKNDIHLIANCGDLVMGVVNDKNISSLLDYERQIENVCKYYPITNEIINFICYGNHDIKALENIGLDIAKVINARRQDLVNLGYGVGVLRIKNDILYLKHPETQSNNSFSIDNTRVVLQGHSHRLKIEEKNGRLCISVPTLSNIFHTIDELQPSFLRINLHFHQSYLEKVVVTHYSINKNKINKLSESTYDISSYMKPELPGGSNEYNKEKKLKKQKGQPPYFK